MKIIYKDNETTNVEPIQPIMDKNENVEQDILNEIRNYDWKYIGEDGFNEDQILYNFRQMYEAVKKIKQWQYRLSNNGK